jgi:hypothetical protein
MAAALSLRVLTTQELADDKALLPLVVMINEAYNRAEEEYAEGPVTARYLGPAALLEDLGSDGLCVLISDTSKDNTPVAVAGAKRWKGPQGMSNPNKDGREWEITPVAVSSHPEYRKRGLVDQCLKPLYTRLLERVEDGEVKLWVKVVEDLLSEYWSRKGFKQVGPQWFIPIGQWHKSRGFTLIDMLKEISQSEVREENVNADIR